MTRTLASLLIMMGSLAWPWAQAPAPQTDTAFRYAFAYHDCAPWDGPALTVVLQTSAYRMPPEKQLPGMAYPRMVVTLWQPEPPVGRWIEIPQIGETGYLGRATSGNRYERAEGRVWLTRLTADRVEGEAHFRFPGQGERVFRFAAPILKYSPLCG